MNLEGCSVDRRLHPRVIPVLILTDEWGTHRKNPLMEIDLILYLMKCVQLLYQEDLSQVQFFSQRHHFLGHVCAVIVQVLTMLALCKKLEEIESLEAAEHFRERS